MKKMLAIFMALVLLMQIAFTNVCFAASTSNTITVKGRLTYKYKNSMSDTEKTAPLKNFTVILYDKDIFSSEKLGETKTDSNGNFVFKSINTDDGWLGGGVDLYFVVKAEDEFSYVVERSLSNKVLDYTSDQVDNVTTDYDFGEVNIGLNAPFHIVNTIRKAAEVWMAGKPDFDCKPPKVKVVWKDDSYSGGTRCGKDTMYIQSIKTDTDEWDQTVIWHEYGHFLMSNFAEQPKGAGGSHNAIGVYNKGLAYSEGWATYFGQYVDGTPNYRDSNASGGIYNEIETPNPDVPNEGNEYANAATLWDITDTVNESHDKLSESFTLVQNVFHEKVASTGKYNQGLSDFWTNWFAKGYAKGKEYEIWSIFNRHGMQFDNEPPKVSFKKLPSELITKDTEVEVNATDNIRVEKVEFYVDGVLKSTCTAPPYKFVIKKGEYPKGKHILQAKAYDPAGLYQTATTGGFQEADIVSDVKVTKPVYSNLTGMDFLTNTILQQIREAFGVAYQPFIVDDGEEAIAVTTKHWDDIGSILKGMGKSFIEINDASLVTYDDIKIYDSIFLNCNSGAISYAGRAASSIERFVREGGTVYASDRAYAYIDKAFPGYIKFPYSPYIGRAQKVNATITDKGLASYLGNENIKINYDLSGWVVIESVSPDVTTHVTGDYYNDFGILIKGAPLLVSFPYGKGKVIYTTFHNERQITDEVAKILEYLVLKVTHNIPENNVIDIINKFDYLPMSIMFSTLSQGEESEMYKFNCKPGYDYLLTMDSYGGDYDIELYKPDGTLYSIIQNPMLSNGIYIMNPEAGEWGYKVLAKEVYFDDAAFVVGIGESLRTPSITNLEEFTNKPFVDIEGVAPGYSKIELVVKNGENSDRYNTSVNDSVFNFSDVMLYEGTNELTVCGSVYRESVINSVYGNPDLKIREYIIECDFTEPIIEFDYEYDEIVYVDEIEISGSVSEECSVIINGQEAELVYGKIGTNPHFDLTVNLSKGENVFTIKAVDKAGNESVTTLSIYRDENISNETNPPKVVSINLSEEQIVSDDYVIEIVAEDESDYVIRAAIDEIEVDAKDGNRFTLENQKEGKHLFSYAVIDRWDNMTTGEVTFYISKGSSTPASPSTPKSKSTTSKEKTPIPTPTPTYTPTPTPTPTTDIPATEKEQIKEPNDEIPTGFIFSDAINHWAKDYIYSLHSKGIINGYPDGTVKPDNEITRAEVAVILAKAIGIDLKNSTKADFKDFDEIPEFAVQSVNALYEKGIFIGYEDGSFRPYNKITRAELITAVSKAYKIEPVGSTTNDFADFEVIPQWALGYINAAVEKGIIKGYPDLTFRPQSNIKRSEVFAVIYNCISWYDKQSKN